MSSRFYKVCPACGSKDLYDSKYPPLKEGATFLQKFLHRLQGNGFTSGDYRSRWGTNYVICRKCGHCEMIQVM